MALDQNDTFAPNFRTHRKLIDDGPKWAELNGAVGGLQMTKTFKDLGNIEILLNDRLVPEENGTDANGNQLQHAAEYDFKFETAEDMPELSAKCLIIKEVIEDLISRTFSFDNELQAQSDNDVDSEPDLNVPRVRRCSSLKTGKTPPGTPSSKKIVRFADVLGLDLADVRTYLDDIPRVPSSAYKDLLNCDVDPVPQKAPTRNLLALFQQPVSLPNFLGRLTMCMVIVENAFVDDPVSFCVKGTIRVRNLSFHKSVIVRFTMDQWKKSTDAAATYVEGSSDGFTDQFQFMLFAYGLDIGAKLEFAVQYRVDGQEFWDNNSGNNYCFQCLPAEVPQPAPMTPGINEQFVTFYYDDQNGERATGGTIGTAPEDRTEDASGDGVTASRGPLSSAEVQEIIARSLGKHKMAGGACAQGNPKPEVLLFFVVLFFSIVILYARRLLF